MSPGPVRSGPVDPGLQPQRTALAWQRTALAVVANALLVAVVGVRLRALPITVLAATLGPVVAILALRRPAVGRPEGTRGWPAMVLVAGAVAGLGLAGAAAGVVLLLGAG